MKNLKNIVLCFDPDGAGSASQLVGLLESSELQLVSQHRGEEGDAVADARTSIGEAYAFVLSAWEPGDRIFVFGTGRGGYHAHALGRLLSTVGVLPSTAPELIDFALSAYALPRTPRTRCDWWRVRQLIEDLNDGAETVTPAIFLGTWDATRSPDLPSLPWDVPVDVVGARHALALDGGPLHRQIVPKAAAGVQTVWFRGAHCDVAGGTGACQALTGIAVDWVLDGARAAGVRLRSDAPGDVPVLDHADAFAGSVHGMPWRRAPFDAAVHASVAAYVQAHPSYRRRLPSHLVWADAEWLARGERLVTAVVQASTPAVELEPVAS